MLKIKLLGMVALGTAVMFPASASAMTISFDEMLCPMETVGEEEINSWQAPLMAANGVLSETQFDRIYTETQNCAAKFGWSDADAGWVFEANATLISATAVADNLMEQGVDPIPYEVALENRSSDELQAMIDDPDNNVHMKSVYTMLEAELGSNLTADISANMVDYIVLMAVAQKAMMQLIEM